jgi:hypothetical protein
MPTRLTVTRPPDFVEFPKEAIGQGIHERFEEIVRRHPGNIALLRRCAFGPPDILAVVDIYADMSRTSAGWSCLFTPRVRS